MGHGKWCVADLLGVIVHRELALQVGYGFLPIADLISTVSALLKQFNYNLPSQFNSQNFTCTNTKEPL